MKYLKNVDWKNLLERAVWTFVEGFLVALPVSCAIDLNGAGWKSALISAGMSGISALKTFILDIAKQRIEHLKALEISDDEYGDLAEFFENEETQKNDEDEDEEK